MNIYSNAVYQESRQFNGSVQWRKHMFGILLTDGVHWLRESLNCYWLVDDIAIFSKKFRNSEDFITAEFRNKKDGGILTLTDGNDNILTSNKYIFTDLAIETKEPLKLWLVYDGGFDKHVLLLPTEY